MELAPIQCQKCGAQLSTDTQVQCPTCRTMLVVGMAGGVAQLQRVPRTVVLPTDTGLPFFAYGLFKQGELGHLRLRDLVESAQPDSWVSGRLLIRDGLPLLNVAATGRVTGSLITFRRGMARLAYQRVAELEPLKQYSWDTITANGTGKRTKEANVLRIRAPGRGHASEWECATPWTGRKDPLFKEALDLVDETVQTALKDSSGSSLEYRTFRLQMAYLLLWAAIERYATIRYHLGTERTMSIRGRIMQMAGEPALGTALKDVVEEERVVFRADDPQVRLRLDRNDPRRALDHYYTVRSNVTHRGKAAFHDLELLRPSVVELSAIFRRVLSAAWDEAADAVKG